MKFVNIDVDEHGHSFFKEVDLPQYGTAQRISSKNQNVLYWKMGLAKPGHKVPKHCAFNGFGSHFTKGKVFTLISIVSKSSH